MSIQNRLDDAIILWNSGRIEGAWIQVLIATAATSRKRFPDEKDAAAFKHFIRQISGSIFFVGAPPVGDEGIEFRFGDEDRTKITLADALYKHLRCTLIHEGTMPTEVGFSKSRFDGGHVKGDIAVGPPLLIPEHFVLTLGRAVAVAPENAGNCAHLFAELTGS